MKNNYEIRGDITAIFLEKRDGTVLETIINTSDLEKAQEYKHGWKACWDKNGNTFYVRGYGRKNNKQINVILHRWLLDAPESMVIDHINHDTLDNRRINLRVLTHAENCQNRQLARNNTSGVRGVSFQKSINKYRVQITVKQKKYFLGVYENLEDAKKAAINGRKKLMKFTVENDAI